MGRWRGRPEEICTTGGFLLGLALDGNGIVYACDVQRGEVLRIDPDTGAVTTYSGGAPGSPFRNPNFPVFDDAGNLYVTDSGRWKADRSRSSAMDRRCATSWT